MVPTDWRDSWHSSSQRLGTPTRSMEHTYDALKPEYRSSVFLTTRAGVHKILYCGQPDCGSRFQWVFTEDTLPRTPDSRPSTPWGKRGSAISATKRPPPNCFSTRTQTVPFTVPICLGWSIGWPRSFLHDQRLRPLAFS